MAGALLLLAGTANIVFNTVSEGIYIWTISFAGYLMSSG
jgi:hypothetical protein